MGIHYLYDYKVKGEFRMKRIAVLTLLAALSVAWPIAAQAQQMSTEEYARLSRKQQKKQLKMLKKGAKKEKKTIKKNEKAQRKAAKKQRKAMEKYEKAHR